MRLSLPSIVRWVRVSRSFVFCVMFCRSLFVSLFFFVWSFHCLSFFDLRLITPLVSSYFSCQSLRSTCGFNLLKPNIVHCSHGLHGRTSQTQIIWICSLVGKDFLSFSKSKNCGYVLLPNPYEIVISVDDITYIILDKRRVWRYQRCNQNP